MRSFALLWIACCVVLFARRPDALTHPQLFAEDGVIFFRDAMVSGIAALPATYAGYHHLLPRLIAFAALGVPVALQPALYVWVTVLVQGLSCALLAPLLRGIVRDDLLRVVAALAVAAVIPADEVIGSVANLQWYLALPMFAAAFAPLEGGAVRIARIAAVVVGFSTPQGLFALPVAVYGWQRRPAGRDPWIPTLYAACSVLNVVTSPRDPGMQRTPHVVQAVLDAIAFRVGDALLLGKPNAEQLAATPWLGLAVGLALLAVVVLVVWRTCGGPYAVTVAYAIGAPVALVLATRSLSGADLAGYALFGGDRYFIGPCAATIVAVAAVLSRLRDRISGWALMTAVLLPGIFFDLREPQLPDRAWTASAPLLDGWRRARDAGAPVAAATVPIDPPHWAVSLPACAAGSHGGLAPSCR